MPFSELLSCVRHLSIRSVITPVPVTMDTDDSTSEEEEEEEEACEEHNCYDCKKKRQTALVDKLPHQVGSGKHSFH